MSSIEKFESFPRIPLIKFATPFYKLDTLSEEYGTNIYIKRDDLSGVGAGGNKVRKLEYLLADARKQGVNTVVSGGALQSNHAAMTALCAKKTGFQCQLALVNAVAIESIHYQQGGNLVLDQLCDASVTRYSAGQTSNECINQLAEIIHKETSEAPYVIPAGGSNAIGALGYVRAGLEIADQIKNSDINLDTLVLGSGSSGTQAGLIVGLALAGISTKVLGISVLAPQETLKGLVLTICEQLGEMLDISDVKWEERVWVDDSYIGPGYGLPYRDVWTSLNSAIEAEGVLFDPVYTGKGFTGFLDYLATKKAALGNTAFLHTGGLVGTLSYAELIKDEMLKRGS